MAEKQKKNKFVFHFTPTRIVLILLILIAGALALFRLYTGLGYVTNLNDQWTWGLWILFDLTGIALAGAGFSLATLTHVLHLDQFKPLARRGLLISLCTYIAALTVLIIEIGRWDNFYMPFLRPGIESPMYEVFICIAAYVLMQCIEFAEVHTDKAVSPARRKLEKIMPVVFIIASLLPYGHQASLGALYRAMPQKLHVLWSSPALPWFFLISAFFVGLSVVTLEYYASSKHYNRPTDDTMIEKLLKISAWIMLVYFVLKVVDLAVRGVLADAFAFDLASIMFLLEMVIGLIIPIIIGFTPALKKNSNKVIFAICSCIGIVLSRVNVIIVGMAENLNAAYFPSAVEWIVMIGFAALGVLIYLVCIENLPFYRKVDENGQLVPVEHGHTVFARAEKLGK